MENKIQEPICLLQSIDGELSGNIARDDRECGFVEQSFDLWKIALRSRKGIVHLWSRPSKYGNPDFFISACNILAKKENYRAATEGEKISDVVRSAQNERRLTSEFRGGALLRRPLQ